MCNGDRRPNSHVTPRRGIITTHALMPILRDENMRINRMYITLRNICGNLINFNKILRQLDVNYQCKSSISPYLLTLLVSSWLHTAHLLNDSYKYHQVDLKARKLLKIFALGYGCCTFQDMY